MELHASAGGEFELLISSSIQFNSCTVKDYGRFLIDGKIQLTFMSSSSICQLKISQVPSSRRIMKTANVSKNIDFTSSSSYS